MNSQRTRTIGRIASIAATLGLAGGLVLSITGLPGRGAPGAMAAQSAGAVEVVNPAGGAPLSSGGSDTDFRFKLPTGAACTGDSANAGYRIQSFLVPRTVALDSLTFDAGVGPAPATGEFRQPLFVSSAGAPPSPFAGNPYVDAQTADAVPAGGPGPIIQPLASFNFAVYDPLSFPFTPGVYNIGIACTLGAPSATQLDKYWSAVMTITADPADTGPAKIRWVVTAAAPTTTTTLSVSPATSAALGAQVTMTATVAPASAVGSVTFKDGTSAIGTMALTNGTATLKKSDLAAGSHSLAASFAPTTADAFAPSASEVTAYTVTATAATTTTSPGSPTTTSLGSTPTPLDTDTGAGSGSGSGSGATPARAGESGELPRTGGTFLPRALGACLLLCLGRAAMLLGRRPSRPLRDR
ncbi:MAG: Ig-like domain-containing protein [Acidimicrobiales bacterium]